MNSIESDEDKPISKNSNINELGYIEALKQLRIHAPLIWIRNNFFLLTQTGLIAYYFRREYTPIFSSLILCILGLASSIIWTIVIKEGREIQRKWRKIAIDFENRVFTDHKNPGPLKYADQQLGEGKNLKISITTILIILCLIFSSIWIILIAKLLILIPVHGLKYITRIEQPQIDNFIVFVQNIFK